VRSLEEHSFGTDLSDAGPRDAAVVFDFFRYRRQVSNATRVFADAGVAVVTWCEIEVPAIGPFDSSVPAVAIAELLVSHVAKSLHQEATARIDRIEALWEETKVFL